VCGERHLYIPLKAWDDDGVMRTANPYCKACQDTTYQEENNHMHETCKNCPGGTTASCAWNRATSCGAKSCN
jgi:hypothetical protein